MSAWISVKERLPEPSTWVITYDRYGVDIALLGASSGLWINTYDDYLNVTHWQPLPEPPEES